MFPHFNQYTSMNPEEILKDDKRVARNRLEVLLLEYILGGLALPSRAQSLPGNVTKANNISAPIERVCDVVENGKIFEITLCTTSDSESDQEKDNSSSSIFAEGFTPPPNFGRSKFTVSVRRW